MNAIEMLKAQHRKAEALFAKIEKTADSKQKEDLFVDLADSLAIHASIEEHHFYPGVKAKATEAILHESVEEHLEIKRVLNDLLDVDIGDVTFDAGLKVLKDLVELHVEEEEDNLFPLVESSVPGVDLEALGQAMSEEEAELKAKGNPREALPSEIEKPAPL